MAFDDEAFITTTAENITFLLFQNPANSDTVILILWSKNVSMKVLKFLTIFRTFSFICTVHVLSLGSPIDPLSILGVPSP